MFKIIALFFLLAVGLSFEDETSGGDQKGYITFKITPSSKFNLQ